MWTANLYIGKDFRTMGRVHELFYTFCVRIKTYYKMLRLCVNRPSQHTFLPLYTFKFQQFAIDLCLRGFFPFEFIRLLDSHVCKENISRKNQKV